MCRIRIQRRRPSLSRAARMLLRTQRPKSRRRLTRMRSAIPPWTMCQGAVGRTQLFVLSRSLRPSEFKRQRDRFGSCRAFAMTDTPADGASVISFLLAAALGANRPPRRSPPFARDSSTRASSGGRSGTRFSQLAPAAHPILDGNINGIGSLSHTGRCASCLASPHFLQPPFPSRANLRLIS
jgi:hypothetical protein